MSETWGFQERGAQVSNTDTVRLIPTNKKTADMLSSDD